MCPQDAEQMAAMRNVPYLNAVGALNYLSVSTRPDISWIVGKLARFNSNPGIGHWKAVKHLFRYLQGTKDLKLTYSPDPTQDSLFTTYVDSDFAGDRDNGKSTRDISSRLALELFAGAASFRGWLLDRQPKLSFMALVLPVLRSNGYARFYRRSVTPSPLPLLSTATTSGPSKSLTMLSTSRP